MIQPSLIVIFATLVAQERLGSSSAVESVAGWWGAGAYVLAQAVVTVCVALVCRGVLIGLTRTGRARVVRVADRAVAFGRGVGAGLFVAATLGLGWVAFVRQVVGDWVLIDEIIALAPALVGVFIGQIALARIDVVLDDALLIRELDNGEPIRPRHSVLGVAVGQFRRSVLMLLAPMLAMLAWLEVYALVLNRLVERGVAPWLASGSPREQAVVALGELVGVGVVFLFAPLLLRLTWDTVPLGAGPLRDRMMAAARAAGVRVGQLLVWRTQGRIANAAVMGLIAPLRLVIMSDRLLETLPERQVDAVLAHELGHVKRGHLVWLVLVCVATFGLVWRGIELGVAHLFGDAGGWVALPIGIGVGLLIVGAVSRRFEWQADAFAATLLSRMRAEGSASRVTPEAVGDMAGALLTVTRIGRSSVNRWTWRHGSIATRVHKLEAISGAPIRHLPIDAHVRLIKILSAIGVCVVIFEAAREVM